VILSVRAGCLRRGEPADRGECDLWRPSAVGRGRADHGRWRSRVF